MRAIRNDWIDRLRTLHQDLAQFRTDLEVETDPSRSLTQTRELQLQLERFSQDLEKHVRSLDLPSAGQHRIPKLLELIEMTGVQLQAAVSLDQHASRNSCAWLSVVLWTLGTELETSPGKLGFAPLVH